MPRETRFLGFGVGSRMVQQQKIGPDGNPETDERGVPVMIPVLELMFIDQQLGDIYIMPLSEQGVEAVKRALSPTSVIVPAPGSVPL